MLQISDLREVIECKAISKNRDSSKGVNVLVKKKFYSLFSIVSVMCILSVFLCSCEKEDVNVNPFLGTWVSSEGYICDFYDSTFNLPSYTNGVGLKGTYSYAGNAATIVYTEITRDGIEWKPISSSEASSFIRTATISGNKLKWGVTTYTRK